MSVDAPPPPLALLRLMTGAWISHAVWLAARLGIADRLAERPHAGEELARTTGMHAPSLYRLLRALAGVGIFREDERGRFALTPLAEPLRSGVPGSLRDFAIMLSEEWHWRAWGELPESVRTGQSFFERAHGVTCFDYWAQHPEAAAIFERAMTSRSDDENRAVVAAYGFAEIGTLVDVGGGHGSLLAAILRSNPAARGILFDLPHVVAGGRQQIQAAGLADRCEAVGGDFFGSVPPGGDAYLLKKVIHDWDDERAAAILRNCRDAMRDGGRLLLVELVIPPGNEPSFGKLLDLLMLVWNGGGRERTEAEHRALLAAAGFELKGIIPTAAPVSVIEARPA